MNLLYLVLVLALGADSPLQLTPSQWEFGTISSSAGSISTSVAVQNLSGEDAEISLVSTCACLQVSPTRLRVKAGEGARFHLTFDPSEEAGAVQKDLLIRTNLARVPKALYPVRGTVSPAAQDIAAGGGAGNAGKAGVQGTHDGPVVDFYASPGCRSCRRLLDRAIPRIERRHGVSLTVREHNILDPEIYKSYLRLLEEANGEERAYPALIVGGTILQGEAEIRGQLPQLVGRNTARRPAAGGDALPPAEPLLSRVALLPVLIAGLLDGVNPCAFTTLVFLISALAVAGRSRLQVLQIGLFFTAAVFATYLLIGLGFFQAVRMASAFPTVAALIRWLLVGVLLLFAAFSLHDYFQLRAERSDRVLLQLPQAVKRRLHRDIRSSARSAALAASSLLLGFLVSLFELACTGQVYFPTLVYLQQVRAGARSLSYLLLYNLAFVLPLLAVFALSYWGVSSRNLAHWVQGRMKTVKMLLAGFFLGLAVLTILT